MILGCNVIAPGGRRLTCRNHGYNKVMKKIVFRHCGLEKICCRVMKTNKPSAASLTKFGSVPCGEVRQKKGLLGKQFLTQNRSSAVFVYANPAE